MKPSPTLVDDDETSMSSTPIRSTTMRTTLSPSPPLTTRKRGRGGSSFLLLGANNISIATNSPEDIVARMDRESRKTRELERVSRVQNDNGPIPACAFFPELDSSCLDDCWTRSGAFFAPPSAPAIQHLIPRNFGGDSEEDGDVQSSSIYYPKLSPRKRRRMDNFEDNAPRRLLF